MRTDQQLVIYLIVLAAIFALAILCAGCSGLPLQDVQTDVTNAPTDNASVESSVTTFGMDVVTLALLKTGAGMLALFIGVGVAAAIGGVMVAVILPAPEMSLWIKTLWTIAGTALIVGPVGLAIWKLSQLAGG